MKKKNKARKLAVDKANRAMSDNCAGDELSLELKRPIILPMSIPASPINSSASPINSTVVPQRSVICQRYVKNKNSGSHHTANRYFLFLYFSFIDSMSPFR